MRRIYPDYAYGDGPRNNCWWDETVPAPMWPTFEGAHTADVAIIGGGFTGVSTALHLAEAGVDVALFEAETPGWGASGRNGGFCCLGGTKLSHAAMARRHGDAAAQCYADSEAQAVTLVRSLINRHNIQADIHSNGETLLAHSARAMSDLRKQARFAAGDVSLHEPEDLSALGLSGPFFGGLTTPIGFGLNPRKFLFGLSAAAQNTGARLFQHSPVQRIKEVPHGFELHTPNGQLRVKRVVVATNGYSSEDVPDWLRGRYVPSQSTVLVTRPLTDEELQAQGWTSDQMAYDTRHLLHYFRLMPDRRFLFGMRGGLMSSPTAERRIRRQLLQHFHRLFPAWKSVSVTNMWSGLVSIGAGLTPFIGAVPSHPRMFAGLNYHGNGVAMGTYAGRLLADLAQDRTPDLPHSPVVQRAPRLPIAPLRRAVLPIAYGYYAVKDFSF